MPYSLYVHYTSSTNRITLPPATEPLRWQTAMSSDIHSLRFAIGRPEELKAHSGPC